MFQLFSGVNRLLKLENICIDNNIFRLHYKVTTILLIAFSLIVTARQYVGHPIQCIVEDSKHKNWVNTYCWILSTYTVTSAHGKSGDHVAYPGVANNDDPGINRYHTFYQWVCFILFFQAILFYVPRYLWKCWEGGRLKALTADLRFASMDPDLKINRRNLLCEYFHRNLSNHNLYFFRFFFCELLNFGNVIGQMFLINTFLNNAFFEYGFDVLSFDEKEISERIDPMNLIFPKVSKCNYYYYGPTGTIQSRDSMCVLPLNNVHEKIYIFLWFWFMILASISATGILYRTIVCQSKKFRYILLRAKCRTIQSDSVIFICNKFQVGDWFIFFQLCNNVEPLFLKELIRDLMHVLNSNHVHKS